MTRKSNEAGVYTVTSLVLLLQFILMTTTIIVLGAAIGWPASLDAPAGVDPGPLLIFGSVALQLWILALAVVVFRARNTTWQEQ